MTPYEPGKVIKLTITSDNPMPFSVTSSELDNGLAQLNQVLLHIENGLF
jgi:hypothetical protein